MPKPIFTVILIIVSLFGISACHTKKADSKDLIITTIYPYQILVKQLVGESIDVQSLIPPNASPHTWSPKPSDMQNLDSAKLIVSNGFDLEANLGSVFQKYKDKHVELAQMLNLKILPKEQMPTEHDHHEAEHHEAEHHEAEHHHGEYDPHLWTSPENLVNITNILSAELIKRFPNHAETINQNKHTIIQELMMADVKIMSERQKYTNPGIVTFHNSFYYFTNRYDIQYIGFVQASPGQEPTPRELNDLGHRIQTANVKSVFVEPQINQRSAEVLAKEFGLQIITIDPLGASMNVNTISEYILKCWEIIQSGL